LTRKWISSRREEKSGTGAERPADPRPASNARFVRERDAEPDDRVAVTGEQLLDRLEHQAQQILQGRAQLERIERELERERVKRRELAEALERERAERRRVEQALAGETHTGARERELEAALQRAREDVFVWRTELAEAWARINTLQQRLDARRGILRRTRQKPDSE
jgi:chromosome segregation ATPase